MRTRASFQWILRRAPGDRDSFAALPPCVTYILAPSHLPANTDAHSALETHGARPAQPGTRPWPCLYILTHACSSPSFRTWTLQRLSTPRQRRRLPSPFCAGFSAAVSHTIHDSWFVLLYLPMQIPSCTRIRCRLRTHPMRTSNGWMLLREPHSGLPSPWSASRRSAFSCLRGSSHATAAPAPFII